MPKRRDQIRMSEAEFWQFVESQKTVQVATLGPDGWPHVMPLWFALEDGAIVLETFTKSQKVKNLERDPASPCSSRRATNTPRCGALR